MHDTFKPEILNKSSYSKILNFIRNTTSKFCMKELNVMKAVTNGQ